MNINKLVIRRVKNNDLKKIQCLFFSVFNNKISISYLKNKFFFKNKYISFVAIDEKNKKIIGHIGYSIVKLRFKENNYNVALRFTSMIDLKYQKLGLYKRVLFYSFKFLKKINIYTVLCWPNDINLIGCQHHNNFNYISSINTYYKKIMGKKIIRIKNIVNCYKCNYFSIKFLKNINVRTNKNNFSINKSLSYIKKRYFQATFNNKEYFFFLKGNNCIIFSIINSYEINITEMLINTKKDENILGEFINQLKKYNIIIKIWTNQNNNTIFNLINIEKFKVSNLKFNFGYYSLNTKKTIPYKYYLKFNYSMGDADVF